MRGSSISFACNKQSLSEIKNRFPDMAEYFCDVLELARSGQHPFARGVSIPLALSVDDAAELAEVINSLPTLVWNEGDILRVRSDFDSKDLLLAACEKSHALARRAFSTAFRATRAVSVLRRDYEEVMECFDSALRELRRPVADVHKRILLEPSGEEFVVPTSGLDPAAALLQEISCDCRGVDGLALHIACPPRSRDGVLHIHMFKGFDEYPMQSWEVNAPRIRAGWLELKFNEPVRIREPRLLIGLNWEGDQIASPAVSLAHRSPIGRNNAELPGAIKLRAPLALRISSLFADPSSPAKTTMGGRAGGDNGVGCTWKTFRISDVVEFSNYEHIQFTLENVVVDQEALNWVSFRLVYEASGPRIDVPNHENNARWLGIPPFLTVKQGAQSILTLSEDGNGFVDEEGGEREHREMIRLSMLLEVARSCLQQPANDVPGGRDTWSDRLAVIEEGFVRKQASVTPAQLVR